MCSIQNRRVRGFVAWVLFKVERFGVWARVFDSRLKGSRFDRRLFFKIEGFEVWARVRDSRSKGSRFGHMGFLMSKGSRFGCLVAKSSISSHRPSVTIFFRFGIPCKSHRFRYSILYRIDHFLTQTLQDQISPIWCARFMCSISSRNHRFRVLASMLKGSRFCRLDLFESRRVRGLGACVRFKVEGFEVWSLGLFLKSEGSGFGRVCSIQGRRVRSFVA